MLCERCHSKVKPVVALDIDGTLGDYHSHFLRFLGAYLGVAMVPAGAKVYDGSKTFSQWCVDTFSIDHRTFRDIKLAYRQGAQKRSMPVYAGARDLAVKVQDLGAELWLTTSRPYMRLDNVDPDTRFWLARHSIPFDHLLYDKRKYDLLAERVDPARVAAVLDDLGYMYDSAARVFGPAVPILRCTPWNSAVSRRLMTGELWTAGLMIGAHICDWMIKHDFDQLPETPAA